MQVWVIIRTRATILAIPAFSQYAQLSRRSVFGSLLIPINRAISFNFISGSSGEKRRWFARDLWYLNNFSLVTFSGVSNFSPIFPSNAFSSYAVEMGSKARHHTASSSLHLKRRPSSIFSSIPHLQLQYIFPRFKRPKVWLPLPRGDHTETALTSRVESLSLVGALASCSGAQ